MAKIGAQMMPNSQENSNLRRCRMNMPKLCMQAKIEQRAPQMAIEPENGAKRRRLSTSWMSMQARGQAKVRDVDGEACTETRNGTDIESCPQHLTSDRPLKA